MNKINSWKCVGNEIQENVLFLIKFAYKNKCITLLFGTKQSIASDPAELNNSITSVNLGSL